MDRSLQAGRYPAVMSEIARERTLVEAFHRGCAVILTVLAATLIAVFCILLVCGCDLPADALVAVPAALVLAAVCELRSRLARAR